MNIREHIVVAMANSGLGDYIDQAETIIDSLEQREEAALEVIRNRAAALGATEEQVEGILIAAGLVEDKPSVVEQSDDDLKQRIASLERSVSDLASTVSTALTAARRQGVSI